MSMRTLRLFLSAAAAAVPAVASAQAIELLGTGLVPGSESDGLTLSPALLEDGVTPHDQVGGFGSAITYTGVDHVYIATPDRGPADGATTYNDRVYAFSIEPTASGVEVTLLDAKLLKNGAGGQLTGSSAAFDASGSPASLRFDPEGIALAGSGGFFVSDEYGPYVYKFDEQGRRVQVVELPAKLAIAKPSALATAELPPNNLAGRQSNRGMEGLAITPDGTTLYGMMQNALIQDGALDSANARIGLNNRLIQVDLKTGTTREYVYTLSNKANGVNEIAAINDHEFLVIERDGKAGAAAAFKQLWKIDVRGASDVSAVASLPTGALPAGIVPVKKELFLDLLAPAYGLAGASFPEKIEGIAFGPELPDGRLTLVVTSDNDFVSANPSRVFVFAVDPAALDFEPLALAPKLRVAAPASLVSASSFLPVPVAVLGSPLFPVSGVDRASLRFGGAAPVLNSCLALDLNGDRERDLLCGFVPRKMDLGVGTRAVALTGATKSGTPIDSRVTLRVVR